MAGYIPAPQPPGRLVIAGDATALELSRKAGDVTLNPGAGSLMRRQGRTVTIDNLFSESSESFHLFKSGALSALTLGTWRNTYRAKTVYLRKLLANFATAQTTADAANYYRLHITDSASGSAVLPLTSAGQLAYLLDQGYGSVLDQGLASYSGIGYSMAVSNDVAFAVQFSVSQTQTITGLSVAQGLSVDGSGSGGTYTVPSASVHGCILDVNGNVIAEAMSTAPAGIHNSAPVRFVFTESAILKPGNTYYFAFDLFGTYPVVTGPAASTNAAILGAYISDTQTGTGNPGAINVAGAPGLPGYGAGFQVGINFSGPNALGTAAPDPVARAAAVNALRWTDIIGGAPLPLFLNRGLTFANMARNFAWQLMGSPSGLAVLTGDLTFAIDTVGAPPTTGIGSDLNLHSILSPS